MKILRIHPDRVWYTRTGRKTTATAATRDPVYLFQEYASLVGALPGFVADSIALFDTLPSGYVTAVCHEKDPFTAKIGERVAYIKLNMLMLRFLRKRTIRRLGQISKFMFGAAITEVETERRQAFLSRIDRSITYWRRQYKETKNHG